MTWSWSHDPPSVRRRAGVAAGMPVRELRVMARLPDAIELTMPDGTTKRIGLRWVTETVHRCPEDGAAVTPCCGRAPVELPRDDRMTVDGAVNCRGLPR